MPKPTIYITLAAILFALPLSFNACGGGFEASLQLASENLGSSLGPIPHQDLPTAPPPATAKFKFQCTAPEKIGEENPAIKRLTKSELINTLKSVLGVSLFNDSVISGMVLGMPDSESSDVTHTSPTHTKNYLIALMGVADRLAELVESQATLRAQIFGNCTSLDDICARNFIQSFGAKVYRRPLTDAEVTAQFNFYKAQNGGQKGMISLLYAMIQAPPMAFHIESGKGFIGTRTRLTDYEIASRISYQTLASPPDQALLDAAKAGKLQNLTEVKLHVERLLNSNSPQARERIKEFFTYYADLEDVSDPLQAIGDQHGILTFGLGEEMAREAYDYINHIFWTRNGGFKELMTSRDSFPRNEGMRKILGATNVVAADGRPVLADQNHIGLLHRPALLSTSQPRTAPILRGAHVRIQFLCDALPPAPQDAVNAVLVTLNDIENQTNRAKTELITSSATCVGCHRMINPIGFAFESYDQLGVKRTQEVAFDATGTKTGTFPINTRVSDPMLEDGQTGVTLNDSIELVLAMGNGSKARSCFAQRAFEFIQKRSVSAVQDGCGLAKAESVAHTGSLKEVIVHSIANENILWRHAKN